VNFTNGALINKLFNLPGSTGRVHADIQVGAQFRFGPKSDIRLMSGMGGKRTLEFRLDFHKACSPRDSEKLAMARASESVTFFAHARKRLGIALPHLLTNQNVDQTASAIEGAL
jgi:hypothetical protein